MKNWKLSAMAVAGLLVAAGGAMAESQYGHSSTGAGQVSANATLTVTVNVPKLVLLRVGASGTTQSVATLQGAFGQIPGGVTAPLNDGSTQPSGWDGTAPVITSAATSTVRAYAWTNSAGGGALTASTPGDTLGAAVTVTSGNALNGGLNHPGANLSAGVLSAASVPFAKGAVRASDWTFSISGAAMTTMDAGSVSQTLVYTATTL